MKKKSLKNVYLVEASLGEGSFWLSYHLPNVYLRRREARTAIREHIHERRTLAKYRVVKFVRAA